MIKAHSKSGCFIIAEAGVNHNGDVGLAMKMIDAAASAGADAVKFQTFRAESIASRCAPKAGYQKKCGDKNQTQFEMLKRLELDYGAHKKLYQHCRQKGMIFLSSPFDPGAIDLLQRLGLEVFKIPSGEITNLPYLRKVGSLGKKLILSTGAANLKEIGQALAVLTACGTPKKNITVLHCTSEYPALFKNVNLRAMLTIKEALKVNVGYSDHTLGIEVPIAAVALGASMIEKHFTLDRDMPGPDQRMSLEPEELKMMAQAIRNIEMALGDGIKKPTVKEEENKKAIRKSIVAKFDIPGGTVISEDMLEIKRPGTGVAPGCLEQVIGKKALRDIGKDTLMRWEDLR